MTINQTYSTFHHCLFHNQFPLYIHHSPSNSLSNHNDSPSPSIHPSIDSSQQTLEQLHLMINTTDKHPIPKKSPRPPRSPRSLSPLPSIQTSYHSTPQRSPTHSTPHTAAANSDSPTARTTVLLSPQSSYHSKSLQKILSLNGTNLPCIHLHQIIDLPNLRITRFSPRSLQDPSRPPYTDS